MSPSSANLQDMPVIQRAEDFDHRSGTLVERLIFNHRSWVMALFALVTALFCWQLPKLSVNASFDKMLPQSSPYIQNFLAHKADLRGLGNNLRIVVENPTGTVYDKGYLDTLRQLGDELALLPGVDRVWVKSIWMPIVRWTMVTEEGFAGGPVMPSDFDGSAGAIGKLRENVERGGLIGNLVASDLRSSVILVPLLDVDAATNQPVDYGAVSQQLESLRDKYQAQGVTIRIVGFAKLVGDLLDGLREVMLYFVVAAAIAAVLIGWYTRCWRSTTLVLACSLFAVVWQLGLVSTLGLALDPYSVLVPFLIFAIGVSHGAQKMNGIMQDIGRGTHRYVAARYTFRRLFLAGLTALIADAVGFGVLVLIDIPVIRELAITASVGVAILIFTNLIMLPVMLSWVGVSPRAAQRAVNTQDEGGFEWLWRFLDSFTQPRRAALAIVGALVLAVLGFAVRMDLQIGDLDPGAPELRADSRYNRDNAYLQSHYALSSDQFAIIATTQPDGLRLYEAVVETDRLSWALRQVPGVQTTRSYADDARFTTAGYNEGSPKWLTVPRNQGALNTAMVQLQGDNPDLFTQQFNITPVTAYLEDHKAATLERVLQASEQFIAQHRHTDAVKFELVAGNAGIEAATNIVVKDAMVKMLLYVYGAVIVLCLITFRSWAATVVAVVPLVITSILCEALMVMLGIGVKVATLPVVALGVGIGVDYALYLVSVQIAQQRAGATLAEAYHNALRFTGKVVALVGVTLAAGVVTWAFSPLKFQADMGILLTFMFLWNMVGALLLIPALSCLLLKRVGPATAASAADRTPPAPWTAPVAANAPSFPASRRS